MIKEKIRKERGVSLVSLIIATIILLILTNIIIYNAKNSLKVGKLKGMQNDITNLRDKISSYYAQKGKIPASMKYTNIEHIKDAGVISHAVDTGDFLVIDLSALENLTLNYGEDYEKVKSLESLTDEESKKYTDLYIINEISHNIFYVAGINIDNETYYTDYTSDSVDTALVDLRYVEGVKIPEGFHYVDGTKDTGIVIKSNTNTKEYIWVQKNDTMVEIPNDIEIDTSEQEDFIRSVNGYKGYYKNINGNDVIYLELEKWSPIYDKEAKYTDKNGDIAYIPQDFQVSEVPGENTIDEGLVVRDSEKNEWVWIEVPKSIYTTAISNTDYASIEKDMQSYASTYRENGYTDTWYSEKQHGYASSEDYNDDKNNMLKSVYDKGGFYIGRYEVGTNTARTSSSDTETTPIIKRDAYPYNFVTNKQAQSLSNQLATEGKRSSLMYGIQWDLVLKYIETKGGKTQSELKLNSTTWGNYNMVTFSITRGSYTTNPSITNLWKEAIPNYIKPSGTNVLLTAGTTKRNSTLNIYDLAGNVGEYTLEYTGDIDSPCSYRGGFYLAYHPASSRYSVSAMDGLDSIGFRATLY